MGPLDVRESKDGCHRLAAAMGDRAYSRKVLEYLFGPTLGLKQVLSLFLSMCLSTLLNEIN